MAGFRKAGISDRNGNQPLDLQQLNRPEKEGGYLPPIFLKGAPGINMSHS